MEPNTSSVGPVPLFVFLPPRRQRDFPSERFSWPDRLEITVFPDEKSPAGRPQMPSPVTRSCVVVLGLDVPMCTAHGYQRVRPHVHRAGLQASGASAAPEPRGKRVPSAARSGRSEWLPSKSAGLTSEAPPGAEEQPQASQSTGNNRGRLCSKASGCPKSREPSG